MATADQQHSVGEVEDESETRSLTTRRDVLTTALLVGTTGSTLLLPGFLIPTAAAAADDDEETATTTHSSTTATTTTTTTLPTSTPTTPVTTPVTTLATPQVTAVVTLDLSIARGPSRPLRIEIFGSGNGIETTTMLASSASPPTSEVEYFSSLASGTMKAQCSETGGNGNESTTSNIDDTDGSSMGLGDSVDAICVQYANNDVSYKGSQLWRLVPNKRIDFGRVDSMFATRLPPTFVSKFPKSSALESMTVMKPSTRGMVSMKRGGGAFEFTVTPVYNPALDRDTEDLIVVGRIADEESMALIDDINTIPTRKDVVKMGDVPPLGSNFARACDFAAPDPTCNQFRPLKRIIVTDSTFVPTTSTITVTPPTPSTTESLPLTTESLPLTKESESLPLTTEAMLEASSML